MPPQTVLILKADRLLADGICRAAHEVWPAATYYLETSVAGARQLLATRRIDALLTGLGMLDGDACRFVGDCAWQAGGRPLITVITGRRDPRMLALLGQLPIGGAFHLIWVRYPPSLLRLGWWNGSRHGNHKGQKIFRWFDQMPGSLLRGCLPTLFTPPCKKLRCARRRV